MLVRTPRRAVIGQAAEQRFAMARKPFLDPRGCLRGPGLDRVRALHTFVVLETTVPRGQSASAELWEPSAEFTRGSDIISLPEATWTSPRGLI